MLKNCCNYAKTAVIMLKTAVIMLKMFGTAVPNSVARAKGICALLGM